MKVGIKVMFIGATIDQIRWGSNDDPNKVMKEGDVLEVESVEVHSWHTKLRFVGVTGKFNAVSFKPVPEYINTNPKPASKAQLKRALKELHDQQEADRLQAQKDINQAFRDGFRAI